MKTLVKFAFVRPLLMAMVVALLSAGAVSAQETQAVYRLGANGLSCPFCAYGIEKELSAIDGVATVETDIRSGTVMVTMKPDAELGEALAKEAVEAAGFDLRSFDREG
ncbi:MAG: heavy-metal-associated domain-containing protein [Sphingomonadales bacterium]